MMSRRLRRRFRHRVVAAVVVQLRYGCYLACCQWRLAGHCVTAKFEKTLSWRKTRRRLCLRRRRFFVCPEKPYLPKTVVICRQFLCLWNNELHYLRQQRQATLNSWTMSNRARIMSQKIDTTSANFSHAYSRLLLSGRRNTESFERYRILFCNFRSPWSLNGDRGRWRPCMLG